MTAVVSINENHNNNNNNKFNALLKCYLSQTSLKIVFEKLYACDEKIWKTIEGQANILDNIVHSNLAMKYPVANSYKKQFLKRFFNYIMKEGSEMSDILAETSTKFINTSNSNNNNTSFKTYIFEDVNNNNNVKDENNKIIISLRQSTELGNGMTTGYKIWPCSYGLTKFLLNNLTKQQESIDNNTNNNNINTNTNNNNNNNNAAADATKFIKNKKVLEIGCGTGFIGIGLCKLPLKDQPIKLVLSDFSAAVLSNMIDNVLANNLIISSRDHYAGSVDDYFLINNKVIVNNHINTTTKTAINDNEEKKTQVIIEALMFDIRESYTSENDLKQISQHFDTIIASDMIYDVELCLELMRLFHTLLSFNSALMILIATENRKSDTHVTFNNCLSKYHLKILEVTHDDIKPDNVYFGDNLGNISLYQLVKV